MNRWLPACAMGVLGVCASADALVISDYSPGRHDRFVGGDVSQVNPSFIGAAYDLSGIAVNAGAVMISPHFFVTAAHTGTPGSLTFVARDGQSVTKTVAGSTVLLTNGVSSDVRIGRLADNQGLTAADEVSWYPLINEPESWYIGRPVFVYGQSNQAGVNSIDLIEEASYDNGASPTRVVSYLYDSANTVPDEARLIGGDSGKPLGLIWEGQYTPLGSHYGIADIPPTTTMSASSFLPYYIDQVNAYMQPYGEQVTILTVPEPGVSWIAGVGLLMLLRARRRSA